MQFKRFKCWKYEFHVLSYLVLLLLKGCSTSRILVEDSKLFSEPWDDVGKPPPACRLRDVSHVMQCAGADKTQYQWPTDEKVETAEAVANWEEWWTYDGISGPEYWGRLNPEWGLCNKGRRQSPINVDPNKLLFDPFLPPLDINKETINGVLMNTGQSLVFRVDKENKNHINITGGPLAYRYQFEEFYIHYGSSDHSGSEHTINNHMFPAEIQLYGYNSELYHNMSEAQQKAQGTVGISIMVQISEKQNPAIREITALFKDVKFKGNRTPIKPLSLQSFLPDTISYMTYEGSLTYPGCWETTVWIILNKPIYISKSELWSLRNLRRGTKDAQIGPLGDNSRPVQQTSNRTVRTNINFRKFMPPEEEKVCDISMERKMYYTANNWINKGRF